MTEMIAVREQHRFDEARLTAYLAEKLPEITLPLNLLQFQGGQSNPTFLMTDASGRRYVLRKKPPGAILPSAHAVEREYAAMRALGSTAAPVPAARLLCEDTTVIGTAFYVMDYIDGRVLTDLRLESIPHGERAGYWLAAADGLAALHGVDWRAAGLGSFGKPDAYMDEAVSGIRPRAEPGHGGADHLAACPSPAGRAGGDRTRGLPPGQFDVRP